MSRGIEVTTIAAPMDGRGAAVFVAVMCFAFLFALEFDFGFAAHTAEC
jgi:hypothetical protein